MLSENAIKEIVAESQTTEINVVREYFQHMFLSNLYQMALTERLAFKGGTALRLIYGSPRFSEDLDFSCSIKSFHLKNLLQNTAKKIEKHGIEVFTIESKETFGGYFAIYETTIFSLAIRVELNISFRQKQLHTDAHLITTQLLPAYTVIALDEKTLVKEKISALLTRKKPRDFYDLYFILRNRIATDEVIARQGAILKEVDGMETKMVVKELKMFLPRNHWTVLTYFKHNLKRELNRL